MRLPTLLEYENPDPFHELSRLLKEAGFDPYIGPCPHPEMQTDNALILPFSIGHGEDWEMYLTDSGSWAAIVIPGEDAEFHTPELMELGLTANEAFDGIGGVIDEMHSDAIGQDLEE